MRIVSNSNNILGVPTGFGAWPIGAAMSFDREVPATDSTQNSSFPSARQRGSRPETAEAGHLVSGAGAAPANGRRYTCNLPDSSEQYANHRPSGEICPCDSTAGVRSHAIGLRSADGLEGSARSQMSAPVFGSISV